MNKEYNLLWRGNQSGEVYNGIRLKAGKTTVAAALGFHFLVTLPLLLMLFTRRQPYRYMRAMSPALLTGFSTASSSGTLAVTMERANKGAGIPHAGLVMMVIILQAVHLPLEYTSLIWGVDRILDMARTMTNIWSDATGAAVIAHSEDEINDSVLFPPQPG